MKISNTIESYRKRRNRIPPIYIIGGAVLLIIIGVVVLGLALKKGPLAMAFATKTFTPTITFTVTETSTPTETPTITSTETITLTATQSAPYNYVVQDGDYLSTIITSQGLGDNALILIYILNPPGTDPVTGEAIGIDPLTDKILVGQTIILPNPGMLLPDPTALPTGLVPGSKIKYRVMPGDSLGLIASKFNSTPEAIAADNKAILTDGINTIIYPGWLLDVRINIVTPVPTRAATATPTMSPTP